MPLAGGLGAVLMPGDREWSGGNGGEASVGPMRMVGAG